MKEHTTMPRRGRLLVRLVVSFVSLAVLAVTAFGCVQLRALDRSTPMAQTGSITMSPPNDGQAVEVDLDEAKVFAAQTIAEDAGTYRPAAPPVPSDATVSRAAATDTPTVPQSSGTQPPRTPSATTPIAPSPTPPITAAAPGCVN